MEQTLNQDRLVLLGDNLHMSTEWLSCCSLLSKGGNCWRMVRGGWSVTWQEVIKTSTSELPGVGEVRPPSGGPRETPKRRLETVRDVAQGEVSGVLASKTFLLLYSFASYYCFVGFYYYSVFFLFERTVLWSSNRDQSTLVHSLRMCRLNRTEQMYYIQLS